MGTDYARWLVAKGNSFLPAAASIVKFVERLKKEQWLPDAGVALHTIENTFGDDAARGRAAATEKQPVPLIASWLESSDREELRLVWAIDDDALKYPLTQRPEGRAPYAIEIHRAEDYVVPGARTIGKAPTICNCKEDLSFEWDEEELVPAFAGSSGIFAECEECSRTFEPSKGEATIINPFDGTKKDVRGGAAYRFALKVACGTYVADPRLAFAPDLVALVENEFGRSFYEVGALV